MKRTSLVTAALGFFFFAQTAQPGWTAGKRLTWTSGASEYPAMAIDSANTIHVVWEDSTPGNAEIYHKRSTDGGATWSAAKRLTWSSGESERPAVAIDGSDKIHLVWQDSTPGNYEIYYKSSKDGGATWSATVNLSLTSGGSESPAVAVDSGNAVHLVWQDSTPGNWEIHYKKSTAGGLTWSATKRLTWNSGESLKPAIDCGGNIHVAWEDGTPGNFEIFYKNSTDGGKSWSLSIRLTSNPAGSFSPALAAAPGNQVNIVWSDDATGNDEIYYRRSTDGGSAWSGARRLTYNSGESFFPDIAVGSSDQVIVTWSDDMAGNAEIYIKMSTDGGATWLAYVRLTKYLGPSEYPAVAVDSGDVIHVVWQDEKDGGAPEIYYTNSN
jgi:BNR repeat-like domain